ncbi:MAG: hypothetical protein V9E82_02955 [Candidatus Nanopelagicales bacterium]
MQKADKDATLQVAMVVLAIATIQMLLPDAVTIGAQWLIPAIEVIGVPMALLILLATDGRTRTIRRAMIGYLVLLIGASAPNAVLLLRSMLYDNYEYGAQLLFAGFGVLVMNVLSFAMVYWRVDGGGPRQGDGRARAHPRLPVPAAGLGEELDVRCCRTTCSPRTRTSSRSPPTDTMPLSTG